MTLRRSRSRLVTVATLLTAMTLGADGVAQYQVVRSCVPGGSVMTSTDARYQLHGAAGRPASEDASADDYSLTSGCFHSLPPSDCDDDGAVTLYDYAMFRHCIAGPGTAVPDGCECFDVNRSRSVDLADFAASQRAFTD